MIGFKIFEEGNMRKQTEKILNSYKLFIASNAKL